MKLGRCRPGIVNAPMLADELSEAEHSTVRAVELLQRRFPEHALKTDGQLPDVEVDEILVHGDPEPEGEAGERAARRRDGTVERVGRPRGLRTLHGGCRDAAQSVRRAFEEQPAARAWFFRRGEKWSTDRYAETARDGVQDALEAAPQQGSNADGE